MESASLESMLPVGDEISMPDSSNLRDAEKALNRAARLAFARNLTSYDPGDAVLRIPGMIWAAKHPTAMGRIVWRLGALLNTAFPIVLRKVLRIRPNCENQSLTLAIELCSHLYRLDGGGWISRIDQLFSQLVAKAIVDSHGMGWSGGYPYYVGDPDGKVFIVTPASRAVHSTVLAGNVLLSLGLRSGNQNVLDVVRSIAAFLVSGVHWTEMPSGARAIAYTELDHSRIINVTAETASFLIRAGSLFDRADWIEAGMGGLQFTLETMRPDGSWGYEATETSADDNCHTVMNLKSLIEILEENARVRIESVERISAQIKHTIDKALRYYLDRFFRGDGMVKVVSTSRLWERSYENSYNTAYAIRMLVTAVKSPLFNDAQRAECEAQLEQVVRYAVAHTQRENGDFLLQRRWGKTFWFPNMRCGQLQMCVALAEYCTAKRAQVIGD